MRHPRHQSRQRLLPHDSGTVVAELGSGALLANPMPRSVRSQNWSPHTPSGALRVGLSALLWLGALAGGSAAALAESPLQQLCRVAELAADIEPAPEYAARRELPTAVRAELRSMVRVEVQRSLPADRAGAAPVAQRGDSGTAEAHGNGAAAREAAAQAQQARRNQDVAAARNKGEEHSSLTGRINGTVPGPR